MNQDEYHKLLRRMSEHQRRLMSHADTKDDFASIEQRLLNLLEEAKKRIVRKYGGQPL